MPPNASPVAPDFFRHFFGIAHQECVLRAAYGVEVGASNWRPTALIVNCPFRGFGELTEGVNTDFEFVGRMAWQTVHTFDRCSISGRNRRVSPPMVATIRGLSSVLACANDSGVPPVPSQTGSGFCRGRG